MYEVTGDIEQLQAAATLERAGLVRLCHHLTGDPDAAEDLAQETLFEAWRNAHKLRDPDKRPQWLAGIARNVCRRWARHRGRETVLRAGVESGPESPGIDHLRDNDFDLEVELERDELADILDRAMALLPADTRSVLLQRYIDESPQAEIAVRLGTTENAVDARLRRGKLALRQILSNELSREASVYGFVDPDLATWLDTRVWCPSCGRHRLLGAMDSSTLTLRCPHCCSGNALNMTHAESPDLFSGIKSFKRALIRLLSRLNEYYETGLDAGTSPCWNCGYPLCWRPGLPVATPQFLAEAPSLHVRCPKCNWTLDQTLPTRVLALPEAQRFCHEHPRIRSLPARRVEAAGREALVARFESMTDAASLEVVVTNDTFRVVGIHGAPDE